MLGFLQNFKKPEEPEKKAVEQAKTDVDVEYDPTVPEEEKKKAVQAEKEKEEPKEQKETPKEEKQPKDTVPMKLTDLQLFTASVNTLARNTAELKQLLANTQTDIKLMSNSVSMIRDDTATITKSVQEVSDLKILINAMDVKMENIKIKWGLTQTPITDKDISDGLENSSYKEEYTTLNNILDEINKLKKKIELSMDKMSQEEGYERTDEYRDLYMLGMLVYRIFNVWPPKMKYFGRDEANGQPILLEMTQEQAQILDITERREQEERDKLWESMLSKPGK